MKTVADVMQTNPLTLTGSEPLQSVIEQFAASGVNSAPIVVGGKLVGMVPETALLDVFFDPQLLAAPVAETAVAEFRTIAPMAPLGRAAHLFGLTGLDCLPVVEGDVFAGLVRRRDVLACALTGDAVAWNPVAEMTGFAPPATT